MNADKYLDTWAYLIKGNHLNLTLLKKWTISVINVYNWNQMQMIIT